MGVTQYFKPTVSANEKAMAIPIASEVMLKLLFTITTTTTTTTTITAAVQASTEENIKKKELPATYKDSLDLIFLNKQPQTNKATSSRTSIQSVV